MSKKQFIPLSVPCIQGNEWKYVKECLDTEWVSTAGKYVDIFEKQICRYTGARHAVACVNGTAGLHIALKLSDVGPGDEVIVPTLTFIAPVNAVRYCGAEPIFMDCDNYMNMDAGKFRDFCSTQCTKTRKGLLNKVTGKIIKAVVPVHIFGNPCDLASITRTARDFGLKVIEDATESLGSYYISSPFIGRHTGSIGDFGVYSFNGNKIITTGGGGMIITADAKMADKARYLTTQAKDDSAHYMHNDVGYNYRLTNIQAALGVAQLEQLDTFIEIKKRNYPHYANKLKNAPGLTLLGVPPGTSPNYWFYSLLIDEKHFGLSRDELMRRLSAQGIQSRPLWYPNHLQKPYRGAQNHNIDKALWFHKRALNMPCSVNLKKADITRIVSGITALGK